MNPSNSGAYTLEAAGHAYNPFTTSDIFGQPPSLHMADLRTLPVGLDDSALPQLTQQKFSNPDYVVGSNVTRPQVQQQQQNDKMWQLVLFAVVLGVALYTVRPSSL